MSKEQFESKAINFKTLLHVIGLSVPPEKLQSFLQVAEALPTPLERAVAGAEGLLEGMWRVGMAMTNGENEDIADSQRFQMLMDQAIHHEYEGSYFNFFRRYMSDRKSVVTELREQGIDLPDTDSDFTIMPSNAEKFANTKSKERSSDGGCGDPECLACSGKLEEMLGGEDGPMGLLGMLLGAAMSGDADVTMMRVGPDGVEKVFSTKDDNEESHTDGEGNLNKEGPTNNDQTH